MSIDVERSGREGSEPNLEHLLLAADFVDEYPTLSRLVPGDLPGTRGDMVKRIAGLYGKLELILETKELGSNHASWLNFYLSKSPVVANKQKAGWLTVAVVGTKMPDKISYRRTFVHTSKWEAMMQQLTGEAIFRSLPPSATD